jgi:hypothetical protein
LPIHIFHLTQWANCRSILSNRCIPLAIHPWFDSLSINDYCVVRGIRIGRRNRSSQRKLAPMSYCPTQISKDPSRRCRKTATNRLSYVTTSFVVASSRTENIMSISWLICLVRISGENKWQIWPCIWKKYGSFPGNDLISTAHCWVVLSYMFSVVTCFACIPWKQLS